MRRILYLLLLLVAAGSMVSCDNMDEAKADPASFVVGKYTTLQNIVLLNAQGETFNLKVVKPMGTVEISKTADNNLVLGNRLKLEGFKHVTAGVSFSVSPQIINGRRIYPQAAIKTKDNEMTSGFYATDSFTLTTDFVMVLTDCFEDVEQVLDEYTDAEWTALSADLGTPVSKENVKYAIMQKYTNMLIQLLMKKQ